MKNLVAYAEKPVIHHRQTMLGNFGVRYEINLFSIRKVFNVSLTSRRTGSRKDSKQRNNNPGGSNKTSLQNA